MSERRRLLAVDFGTVRIGLAISDRDRIIASPLETYTRQDREREAQHFRTLIEEEEVGAIVLGMPVHTTGHMGAKALEAEAFGKWLHQLTGLPVYHYDERFTTVEAEQFLQAAKLTSKRRKQRRDRVAAQILLQAFLEAGCPTESDLGPLEG